MCGSNIYKLCNSKHIAYESPNSLAFSAFNFVGVQLTRKDAPLIEFSAPKLSAPASSPTVNEVKFQSIAPSTVKPERFRVLYGSFGIDIIKRILSLTKVTETGVFVQEASIPKGKHKLLMVVEDTSSRKGNRVIEFAV